MKIQLKLLNAYGDTAMTHVMIIHEDDTDAIENALVKLVRHTWVLRPGDTIKIEEV